MGHKTQAALRIGIIGCGNISEAYLRNARLFRDVQIVACADINDTASRARAQEFGITAISVDALMAAPEVELILNLTVPNAHFDISRRALEAGKHVFTEKPLTAELETARALVAHADASGLMIGSAPDTFLGAAGRHARRLMDAGAIGRPVTGTAFMFGHGMEHVHPDPAFYYQPGGGPVLDMGPYYVTMLVNLLGPVRRVQALSTRGDAERQITAAGPKQGTTFPVGTDTSVLSLLEFKGGATISFGASWDVYHHSNHPIELHGTKGSLRLPDPDNFGGTVGLSDRGQDWAEVDTSTALFGANNWPLTAPDRANYRMLGLADMARALRDKRPARASGQLALHVLDVLEAILRAAQSGVAQEIETPMDQPMPMSESDAKRLLADGT